MNIEQFIAKLEVSKAYKENEAVRKLVDESRQTLIDLAHGNNGDALKAELIKLNNELDLALKPPANSSVETASKTSNLIEKQKLREQYDLGVDDGSRKSHK